MFKPTYKNLQDFALSGTPWMSNASRMHPDPRLYKYMWQVFWRGSPVDGWAFLETDPLPLKAAMDLRKSLQGRGEPYIIYNYRLPRRGVSLWNLNHPRFVCAEFAPAYDDDPDPPMAAGHR